MRTLSLQEMPNGYELETPSFVYWVKAGVAFTLGAGGVYVVWAAVWLWLVSNVPSLAMLRMFRMI